nr:acyl-CoA carboxylase epsilon subunit [Streptomyces sp. SN-593]
MIKVERGRPTPEELAAVVALVQARAAAADPDGGGRPSARSAWSDPARRVPGVASRPGPAAWRTSGWPA